MRPTKLDQLSEEQKKQLLTFLRNGAPQKYACASVGITYGTLRNWRERAEQDEEPYAGFIALVEQAEGLFVAESIAIINIDGRGLPTGDNRERGDWHAVTWLLERLHPKDFAPLQKQEHSGPDGGPIPGARLVYLPQKDLIPEPEPLPDDAPDDDDSDDP